MCKLGEEVCDGEFGKHLVCSSSKLAISANHRFEFYKRSRFFIRVHNEALSVATMCVCNPDRSPAGINRLDAAPTPTGFGEIVSAFMAASMLP
jgi:hypothetical protein